MRIEHCRDAVVVVGEAGRLRIGAEDEAAWKLAMLMEGECQSPSPGAVAESYGYSRQRYYQVRAAFLALGSVALASRKRGPKTRWRRTEEVQRQVVRYRYLDPDASVQVVGQKLRQDGWEVSDRSVFRVFAQFGLQKRGSTSAGRRAGRKRSRRTTHPP
jgi:hypothetical protein